MGSFKYLLNSKVKIKSALFIFVNCYNKNKDCLSKRNKKRIEKFLKKINKELEDD